MLKETQQTPYISIFKLIGGEEFICKVVQETTDTYVVSKPLTIGQTSQGVHFIPVLMMADQEKDVVIPNLSKIADSFSFPVSVINTWPNPSSETLLISFPTLSWSSLSKISSSNKMGENPFICARKSCSASFSAVK